MNECFIALKQLSDKIYLNTNCISFISVLEAFKDKSITLPLFKIEIGHGSTYILFELGKASKDVKQQTISVSDLLAQIKEIINRDRNKEYYILEMLGTIENLTIDVEEDIVSIFWFKEYVDKEIEQNIVQILSQTYGQVKSEIILLELKNNWNKYLVKNETGENIRIVENIR